MYGSQLYTNRNEFIEKFREQQGLTPLPDFNSSRFDTQIKQQIEGRWEYLHKLEKLKRIKLEEKRKEKTQKEYEKEFNECTFNPKINNFTPKLNSHKSFVNSQSKSIEQTNLDSSNLLGRQEIWNQKKNMKIETIKQSQTNDELKECHFKPLIVYLLIKNRIPLKD